MTIKIDFKYEFYGEKSKPVILFIHGFMGKGEDWLDVINSMQHEYNCLIIDLPFHGKTTVQEGLSELTFERVGSALISLLEVLKVKKCHTVGYSLGGRIALYLALRYPDFFQKVVLESASPGLKNEKEIEERIKEDTQWAQILEKDKLQDFVRDWYKQSIFANLEKHQKFQDLIDARMKNDPALLAESLRILGTAQQPSLWEELSQLSMPVLLIVGELDTKFKNIAAEMVLKNHNFHPKVIEACSHNIHFQNPLLYTNIIQNFVDKE
jgi:2-succinyl-6-hydroxy-2,4-cyclohexadiene-1-carboxylate synthase